MAGPLSFLQSVLNGTVNGMSDAGQGLVNGAVDAFNLPRDVYQGKVQTDPRYMSDEEFGRTLNLAGNMAGGGITMGSAPEGAIGMFAGRKSQTFPSNKLLKAFSENQGAPKGQLSDAIYDRSGVFTGKDGMMRYEIPDDLATIRNQYLDQVQKGYVDDLPIALQNVLDHPALFEAYPQLKMMGVQHTPGMKGASFNASRSGASPAYIKMDMTGAGVSESPMGVLLHEVQHGVQNIEGFAPGSNPAVPEIQQAYPVQQYRNAASMAEAVGDPDKARYMNQMADHTAWKAYHREAGEVEARSVTRRMDYTPEERQAIHPLKEEYLPSQGPTDYRVPLEQQWVERKILPFGPEEYNPNLPFLAQYSGK